MDLSRWAALATILLCLETLPLVLIPGVILFFLIKGLRAAETKTRAVAPKVHQVFHRINQVTHETADKIAAPVIRIDAATAQVQAMGRQTASLLKRREV